MTTTATATEVQTIVAAATTGRVVTNISAFNPAVPMVDVMVFTPKGAMIVSKSYDAALGAEAIAAQALTAAAAFKL
jgi:hypothetical protein